MKNLILLLVVSIFIYGCEKNDKPDTPNPNNPVVSDPNAMKFSISGISDLSLASTDDSTMALAIAHTGGKQEKLNLSVIDLPANVSASFSTSSAIPSFGTLLTYSTKNAAGGDYKVKIKAVSASDSVTTYEVLLKIAPAIDTYACMTTLPGNYTQASSSNVVTIVAIAKNIIQLKNIDGVGSVIRAEVDCSRKQLTIDGVEQPPTSQVYGGDGTIDGIGNITIAYDIWVGSSYETRWVYLHKQ